MDIDSDVLCDYDQALLEDAYHKIALVHDYYYGDGRYRKHVSRLATIMGKISDVRKLPVPSKRPGKGRVDG